MLPKQDFDWGNLWADLLKGIGKGLLVHDGSRLSQAALAGLEVFDDAQERQGRREREQANGGAYHQDALLKLWSTMSPEEQAAFRRLSPGEQEAWTREWVEGANEDAPRPGQSYSSIGMAPAPALAKPLPHQTRPLSANPIDNWRPRSILPPGLDGAFRLPTYRR